MRKKDVLLLIVLLASIALPVEKVSAQLRFGLKGGIDVIDHKISTDILKVSNRLGYQLGGTMELLVPGVSLGVELSALYGRKEYKVEEKVENAAISDYDYISIPLVIKKRFDFSSMLGVFVSAGGFANVRIDGGDLKVVIDNTIDQYKSKDFEAGVSAGAGLRLLDHFDLGLYFRSTLTERYSEAKPEIKKIDDKHFKSWTVGLTYYF